MWRKYWVSDPNKTIESNDKDFDEWIVKKMGEMAKRMSSATYTSMIIMVIMMIILLPEKEMRLLPR